MLYALRMANYNQSWYQKNKERILASQKKRRQEKFQSMTEEEIKLFKKQESEKNKQHYLLNRKRILSYKKKYAENNKDKVNESRKRSRQKNKDYHYLKKYKLTKDQYYQMLEQQNYRCLICLEEEKIQQNGRKLNLAVDHCHKTGQVRGLLCASCNTSLGKFNDDISLLQKAIDYLRSYEVANAIES
jgi:hypothetical protein